MISRNPFFSNFTKSSTPKSHSLSSLKKHTLAITTTVYPVASSNDYPHYEINNGDCRYNSRQEVSVIGSNCSGGSGIDSNNASSRLESAPSLISTASDSSEPYLNNYPSTSTVRTSYVAAPKPSVPSFRYGVRIPTPLSSPVYASSIKSSSSTSKSSKMEHHPRNHRGHHAIHSHVRHHMPGALSTDTLSSSYSNGTSSSGGEMMPYSAGGAAASVYDSASQGSSGRHKKKSSDTNVLEDVFGIYPEERKMGHGVSVADVMASKLFKWGNRSKLTPSTIPTPQPSSTSKPKPKSTGNSSCRGRPLPPSQFTAPLPTPPPSNTPSSVSVGNESVHREHIPRSVSNNVVPPQQPKYDDLLERQRQLEEKIQQLKLERNALLELDADHAVRDYDAKTKHPLRAAGLPQMPPQPSTRSPIIRTESLDPSLMGLSRQPASRATFQSTTSTLVSSASGASSIQTNHKSRQFPASKYMHPLKTTPMAIPSATKPYATRPLPVAPIDSTPPPEYDQVIPTIEKKQYYGGDEPDSPTCKDMKIAFPMPPTSHGILLEQKKTMTPSPKAEEIETEEILGWLDTMSPTGTGTNSISSSFIEEAKVAGLRSGPPNTPLPKPPGDIKHPAAIDPTTYSYYARDVKHPIPEVDESTLEDKKAPRVRSLEKEGKVRQRSRTRLSTRPPAAQAAYRQREAQGAVDV